MYKILPDGVVNKLEITLIDENNSQATARLTVTQTAYTEAGKAEVAKFDQEAFNQYMAGWQRAINYYLEKDIMIPNI